MDLIKHFGIDIEQIFVFEKLGSLLRLIILLIVGLPLLYMFSKWVRKSVSRKLSAQQGMIFSKLVLYLGVFIITFSILNEFGFKLTHLIGAAGIITLAIGFASQTSVSNIISGLFLIAEKPFEVNDVITVGSTTGVVLTIDILSIKIRTFDNRYVRIPNETIIKSEVTNITRFPIRRVDLNIGVAYKEDIGKVRSILLDIARKNSLVLNEPEPLVIFSGFGNSSIDFLFAVWATKADWLAVKNGIAEEVKNRFDKEGIEIPFPHLSLYSGSATDPIAVRIENFEKSNVN
ncbi:mechanosensitive ion channel family protein [candidate division KSB1 bacterium]|nr:mechanosensitive ion channel family protein [candidate division KSB1 bacterium]